jgi:hypothetical protein
MSSASSAMADSISDEWYYKRYAASLASTPSHPTWDGKECASIDTESISDPEFPRPTRLYQCALVLAGFFATFQTIGLNQTYGIFQASRLAESLLRYLHQTFCINDLLNRIFIRQRKATSLMVLVDMPWPRSSGRSEVVLRGVGAFLSPCSSQEDAT